MLETVNEREHTYRLAVEQYINLQSSEFGKLVTYAEAREAVVVY